MLLSKEVKELINLALLKLEIENPTQVVINEAVEYLKDTIQQIKEEKEQQTEEKKEYKVWLFNALYDTNYVENEFPNVLTGKFQSQNTYKRTEYIEIPLNLKELILVLPICGNVGYHVANFYDENKNFLYGVSPNTSANTKYHMTEETLKIVLEGSEKYFVLGSSSSGDLANAYYISSEEVKKIFIHESDSVYNVNTVEELKTIEAKAGDTIITKGYYEIGDNGEAIYDIVTYEEYITLLPKDIQMIRNAKGNFVATPVDEFGNHTLNNGLVAKMRIVGEVKPEQYGAKGNGITNDCQAFTHMFAQVKTGKIIFRENATYALGLIYEDDTISSFKDNPYKAYMTGNLLGGQLYGKPIMANIKDVEFVGNNAKIELLNDQFGNNGMGLLNFAGRVDGLKIHDLRFDGKGRNLTYATGNKNSNHTLFYAPSTFTSKSTLLKSVHPLYLEKEDKFDSGYFKNVEINNCHFYDAGAMHKRAGDWGGDFILVINPTAMDNVNIHHNRFEAWGRWVFAVDLGGNGECMTNVKFNDNICLGANACKYSEENYSIIKNGEGKGEYVLQTPDKFINDSSSENSWRWRGLGFIDYEAKKCWKNMELQRNLIVGSAGWAINGNSRISEDFLIKDNIWLHQGGGYPYLIEFYSGFAKNWLIENNIIPGGGCKMGLTSENITVRNNKGNVGFRMFGLQGNIIFEDNKKLPNDGLYYHKMLSLEGTRRPDYLPDDIEQKAKLTFRNNDFGLTGGRNYNVPYLEFDICNNKIDWIEIQNFYHTKLGANDFSSYINGATVMYGFQDLTPEELNNNLLYPFGFYYEEGDIVCDSLKNSKLAPKGVFFSDYILTPEQKKIAVGDWKSYQSLIGKEINGITYNDYKIICTKSGIIPQCGCWGFENQMTGYEDLLKNKNKLKQNAYIYYKDNLYRNIGATGSIDIENPPIHTQGVKTCGEVELEFVDKIAMAKLVGIE